MAQRGDHAEPDADHADEHEGGEVSVSERTIASHRSGAIGRFISIELAEIAAENA